MGWGASGLDQLLFLLVPPAASLLAGAQIAYLVVLRLRRHRRGA